METQWKTTLDASKIPCEIMTTKNKPTSNSRPHTYFTEHLMCVADKPTQEHNGHEKNSSLLIQRLNNIDTGFHLQKFSHNPKPELTNNCKTKEQNTGVSERSLGRRKQTQREDTTRSPKSADAKISSTEKSWMGGAETERDPGCPSAELGNLDGRRAPVRRPKPSLAATESGGSRKLVHEEIKQRPKSRDRRRKSDRENLAAEKESGPAVHLLHETENELLNGRTDGASQPRGNGDRNKNQERRNQNCRERAPIGQRQQQK
jgi:hypothetical protein